MQEVYFHVLLAMTQDKNNHIRLDAEKLFFSLFYNNPDDSQECSQLEKLPQDIAPNISQYLTYRDLKNCFFPVKKFQAHLPESCEEIQRLAPSS